MAVEWRPAPQHVLDLVQRVIDQHHDHLNDARIAIIMRSEAPNSNGRITLGKCQKVNAQNQVFMDFDYVIWLAQDKYVHLTVAQREALIDHELCHCQWDGDTAKIRPHDVEEFAEIIERRGFWWPSSDRVEIAMQAALPLPKEPRPPGGVGTIDFGRIAKEVESALQEDEFDDSVHQQRG